MAIPQKGSRKIVVDGNEFIWKIKKYPSHNERHDVDYRIPIQHVEGGQLLLVPLGYCRFWEYNGSHFFPITPSIIEKCIKLAIKDGWKYLEKLPPLTKNCSTVLKEEIFILTKRFIENIKKQEYQSSVCLTIANSAQNLLDVGENEIALENAVTNICEYNIKLQKDIIDLAVHVFAIYGNNEYILITKSIKQQ